MKRMIPMLFAAISIAATLHAGDEYSYRYKADKADKGDKASEKAEAAVEREEDLYDEANDALDEHDYRRAAKMFSDVSRMKMAHADAATYWYAYSQSKMGLRSEALSTIVELQRTYPKSRWAEDGKALEVEIRQSSGQTIQPEHVGDEELKLLALNGLMNSNPDQAMPIVIKILDSNTNTIKIKDRALFVIAQSGSPQAIQILSRTAKENAKPELRYAAVKYLGIFGSDDARKVLIETYNTSTDLDMKKKILRSFQIAGDKSRLLQIAKTEQNPDLRGDAVRQLGVMGARSELAEMYNTESSTAIRKSIIQAMFIGGNADKLGDIARNEKDPELRRVAIRNLGLMGGERSAAFLKSIYDTDPDRDVKHEVINSFFIQGNSHTLVELARKEKDPELKKQIVSKLSIMGTKEAADYLMEFLKD